MPMSKTAYSERLKDPCTKCGNPMDRFPSAQSRRQCKACIAITQMGWRAKNGDKVRRYAREYFRRNPHKSHQHKLSNRYAMTVEQYNALLLKQGGECAICRQPETRVEKRTGRVQSLSVDHCHVTGINRGLLCDACNRGLGLFEDNPGVLLAASEYLAWHLERSIQKAHMK